MIIKRKYKTLIKGDVRTILTEASTLMFDIRQSLLRGGVSGETVDRVMLCISEAAKARNPEEHLARLQAILDARKEGGGDGES